MFSCQLLIPFEVDPFPFDFEDYVWGSRFDDFLSVILVFGTLSRMKSFLGTLV
jgi:hypothetical protein